MEIIKNAQLLPDEWNEICKDNYAMQRDFLYYMEQTNPCNQNYYIFRDNENKINSVFMTFQKRKHNIAMFSPISFKLDTTLIYVPLSIANSGMIIGEKTKAEVEKTIKNIKGCKLILNLKEDVGFKDFAFGLTCPNILLDINWNSFEEYFKDLRSNYRRRYKKAIEKSKALTFTILDDNRVFDDHLYSLYEQVFNQSKFQVEKLTKAYFQGNNSKIIVAKKETLSVGFIQLIENKDVLVFGFIGMDYKYHKDYDLYISLLLKMIEYAINHQFKRLDLGQTADEAKLKLGGFYEKLYAYVHHTNFLLNSLIKFSSRFIEYKPVLEEFHVFKSSVEDK